MFWPNCLHTFHNENCYYSRNCAHILCRHSEIAKQKNKFRAFVVQFSWAILLLSRIGYIQTKLYSTMHSSICTREPSKLLLCVFNSQLKRPHQSKSIFMVLFWCVRFSCSSCINNHTGPLEKLFIYFAQE